MKALNWIISLSLHGMIGVGIFLTNRFSSVELPEQTAPCTIPLDIQNFASISRAPKSKPKSEQVQEQKKRKSTKKSNQDTSRDVKEEPISFDEMLDRLEKKNNEPKKSKASSLRRKKKASSEKVPPSQDSEEDVHHILKDITERPKGPSAQTPDTDSESDSVYGAAQTGQDIAVSILDRVQTLLQNAWRLPALSDNGEKLVVLVELELNPDATVARATILGGSTEHPAYAIAAESAVAAAFDPSCNPLPLPLDQYSKWKKLRIHFSPR
ncbi:hypothetical protein [Holospora curviuscula]|uniref:Protein TolA n=1 Tax=Holospora curviuscula TaxID=1082868 RepID=A0A2S5R9C0_9PROT|nr:hypothetical protein [Holospora curviuscula]PPE03725.1 hypothetical protein HCUR_00740 [Holospora curviuscula]